jgi:hypothetical protein
MQPGPVNLGATDHITIVQGEGRRSARETIFQEIMSQSRTLGYYTIEDRSEEGIEVNIAGRTVTIEGAQSPVLKDGQMGLRVDVIEWDAEQATKTETYTDNNGNERTRSKVVTEADVVLGVTLFDITGEAILAETEYVGEYATEDKNASEDSVIKSAARSAVAQFLGDITPKPVTRDVRIDDSDDGQEKIIETAEAGNLAQAVKDLEKYLKEDPNNAAAVYNLAVFVDATGDYKGAMALYDEALSMSSKDFYSEARAACAKRLADAQALKK